MGRYAEAFKDSVKEAALLNAVSIPVSIAAGLYLGSSPLPALGMILLLESVALMLAGGVLDLADSATSRGLARLLGEKRLKDSPDGVRSRKGRAVVFTATGILLFAETVLLAVPYVG